MTRKVFLALALTAAATTVSADALYDELVVCRDLPDDARLICYDAAVDRNRQGASARPPAATRAAPPAAAAAAAASTQAPPAAADKGDISQEDLFGKNQSEIQRTVEEATGNERIESLNGIVTRVQKSGYDKVVITLDNGQVWRQVDASSLRLRVGDTVEIERAAMGSYMLQKKGSKRSMRVSRED